MKRPYNKRLAIILAWIILILLIVLAFVVYPDINQYGFRNTYYAVIHCPFDAINIPGQTYMQSYSACVASFLK